MGQDIQHIVRGSEHLTEYDKDVLCALYENLRESQNGLFDKIADKVREQMLCGKHTASDWAVVTALIDKADTEQVKKSGLYEICDITPFQEKSGSGSLSCEGDNLYNAGVAFLKCPYHEIGEYVGRRYKARGKRKAEEYDVYYRLVPFTACRSREELLERTAGQYQIEQPVLFSPLSRRAVTVKVDFGDKAVSGAEEIAIDFMPEENGLSGLLLGGKTLVWNVEITAQHAIPRPKENIDKKIVPLFDSTYQLYEFSVEKNAYILMETQDSDVKRYGSSIYLGLGKNQSPDNARYWKLALHEYTNGLPDKVRDRFHNFYAQDRIRKERVRTEAEIEYVLGCFQNDVAEYMGISRSLGDRHAVRTYESRDAYHYTKDKIFRSSAVCYVRFKQSDSWLFEDYVSYIMAYMNYFYPEFYWVGVV